MSRHLRICIAGCFFFAGLSTAAASSNPFAALFGQAAPAEATTQPQAPAQEECLLRPGKSTASGQHWFYRSDGHRKCWFAAAEQAATSKRPVRDRATKHAAATPNGNKGAPRKREAFADAHDELLRSTRAETPQPAPRAPELKVVDAVPVTAVGVVGASAAAPTPTIPASDQFTPEQPTPAQLDGETLLATAPAATDAATTSTAPATPIAAPSADAGDAAPRPPANWLGVLLMVLGLVSLLSSSRSLRRTVRVWRKTDPRPVRARG